MGSDEINFGIHIKECLRSFGGFYFLATLLRTRKTSSCFKEIYCKISKKKSNPIWESISPSLS